MWLVMVYRELEQLSERTLSQAGLLSRATASNSCREDIGLMKLLSGSTLYRKVAERRGILPSSFFLDYRDETSPETLLRSSHKWRTIGV